jgi:hypothetical protein
MTLVISGLGAGARVRAKVELAPHAVARLP